MDRKNASIEGRLKTLIDFVTVTDRKWKEMEAATGIEASSWVDFYRGKKRASASMIEAVSKRWHKYAYWLATGFGDASYGHEAPDGFGFPEQSHPQSSSNAYFEAVSRYHDEALKVIRYWYQLRFGDELPAESQIQDKMLRSAHNLGLPDAVTSKLKDLQRDVEKAFLLRRAEIQINVEMPKIRYEETSALIETVRSLIAKSGREAKDLEEKMAQEIDRLERHLEMSKKLAK